MNAKFITIEGIEGAGKSTALQFIQQYFMKRNIEIVITREPGGTPFAEELRCLLLHHQHSEKITNEAELLLMFAGRVQHIHEVILPALQQNKWVLSDRYIDATYAYQGGGRAIDMNLITQLDHMIVKNLYPVLTILMDLPVSEGLNRAQKRDIEKDRIESEPNEFFENVRNAYLQRAKTDPKRIKIVDASFDLNIVQNEIKTILDSLLLSEAS